MILLKAGEKYITADIARFGKDSTTIGYWEGWRLEEIHVYNKAFNNRKFKYNKRH